MYKSQLDEGNKGLAALTKKVNQTEAILKQYEEDRCQQCHSSINQFVVFEKYAEMNNKYDVKHFSDLIDQFDIQAELAAICEDIEARLQAGKTKS